MVVPIGSQADLYYSYTKKEVKQQQVCGTERSIWPSSAGRQGLKFP